jgi:hypothetical protein
VNYHRGLLFWGLALITGGAVALAAQQGYIDSHALAGAWRLWPLILIAIGVSILAARTPFAIVGTIVAALVIGAAGGALVAVGPGIAACGGADPTSLTTRHGSLGRDASVQLEFNCGTLEVAMADGTDWTVASGQQGGSSARISADSSHLEVRPAASNNWFNDLGRQHWVVSLPTAATSRLEISPNAAETRVDLGGGSFTSVSIHPNAGSLFLNLANANLKDLELGVNAGSASIIIGGIADRFPVTRSLSIHVNAGSIEACIGDGVALQVTSDPNITFSTNLDTSGLDKTGSAWSTPGYAEATDKVHIQLDGNAGSFTLNPEGGCS